MLLAENLWKAYKREPVLCGVSFNVHPFSVLGICGGNGTGKTTLINVVASVLPPDQGDISLMGIPLRQKNEYRRHVGYVPQNLALSSRLTVEQNLVFSASIKGFSGKSLRLAVEEAAVRANVTGFLKKQVSRCSGGMARRANLAAGLIGSPSLVLLDEPTAGIDEENRVLILQSVVELRNAGCMVLIVNHYAHEMAKVCDRIITLKDGRIAEEMAYAY
jgi:ABC-2 type transport system ATP-binding protein